MTFAVGNPRRPECQQCGLYKRCRNPFIPPAVEQAGQRVDLVIVGEAPGRTEDARGEVFCGPAGVGQDEMISASSWVAANVAFTNAVQCWPGPGPEGGDGKPTMEQVRLCRPLLIENLNALQAPAIVGVGQWGGRALADLGTLTLAGKTPHRLRDLTIPGLTYKPAVASLTYHPAAPLHGQPWLKDIIVADLNVLYNRLPVTNGQPRKPDTNTLGYAYSPLTPARLRALLGPPVVLDLEYSGTGESLYSIALQVQGVNWGGTICRPDATADVDEWRSVLQDMVDKTTLIAGHNVREDLWALARFGVKLPEFLRVADSLTLARMLWENDPDRSLNTLAVAKLGMNDYEADIRPYKKESPADFGASAPKDILLHYNVGDVVASAALLRRFGGSVPPALWAVLMEAEGNLILTTWDGQHVHQPTLEKFIRKYARKEKAALANLRVLTGRKTFNPDDEEGAAYPFKVLKWKPTKMGKTGPSLDKEVLLRVIHESRKDRDRRFARALLDFRESVVHLRRLRNDITKNLDKRSCVHAKFNTAAARTLRDSSNRPNFQNLAPEIRGAFTTRW